MMKSILEGLSAIFVLSLLAGCTSMSEPDIVVYAALDSEFSQPILADFAEENQLVIASKFDTEAYKTIGLYRAIIAEQARPRCDLFWNNEIILTLRLQKLGLLQAYDSPLAKNYPKQYRSAEGYWYGFAARARVLIVNTEKVSAGERPRSILDLVKTKWKGRLGMAKPLYGTTFTHTCCLFAHWGDEKAKAFYQKLKRNEIQILGGNKDVAESVALGRLSIGLTDTDDAVIFREKGYPVDIVYLDRDAESDDLGTLFIPNTLAILKNCPHPEAAKRLVDHLLSAQIEARLAEGPSAQIPLGANVEAKPRVETPQTVKPLNVDFAAAAEKWDVAREFLRQTFGAN